MKHNCARRHKHNTYTADETEILTINSTSVMVKAAYGMDQLGPISVQLIMLNAKV